MRPVTGRAMALPASLFCRSRRSAGAAPLPDLILFLVAGERRLYRPAPGPATAYALPHALGPLPSAPFRYALGLRSGRKRKSDNRTSLKLLIFNRITLVMGWAMVRPTPHLFCYKFYWLSIRNETKSCVN